MSITVTNSAKVFGELMLVGKSKASLKGLMNENIILPKQKTFVDNYGRFVTLDFHDHNFERLENELGELSNIAKIDCVVSIDIVENEEEKALWGANLLFSELSVDIFGFELLTYEGIKYKFDTLDMSINWNQFLANNEI
jgi:hypothetical protein